MFCMKKKIRLFSETLYIKKRIKPRFDSKTGNKTSTPQPQNCSLNMT